MPSLNRRGFLGSSTALAAGIAAVSGLASAVHLSAAEVRCGQSVRWWAGAQSGQSHPTLLIAAKRVAAADVWE